MVFNIFGPFTASLITAALLKMAARLILMHEDLFWRQREKNGLRLSKQVGEDIAVRAVR
jgi:hypothetical protein